MSDKDCPANEVICSASAHKDVKLGRPKMRGVDIMRDPTLNKVSSLCHLSSFLLFVPAEKFEADLYISENGRQCFSRCIRTV